MLKSEEREVKYEIGKVQRTRNASTWTHSAAIQRAIYLKQQRTFATGTIFLPLATGQASQTLILTWCRPQNPTNRKVSRTYTFAAPTNIPAARTKQSPENRPNQPQSETSLYKHHRRRYAVRAVTHGLRASPAPTSKPRIRHLVLKDTTGKGQREQERERQANRDEKLTQADGVRAEQRSSHFACRWHCRACVLNCQVPRWV